MSKVYQNVQISISNLTNLVPLLHVTIGKDIIDVTGSFQQNYNNKLATHSKHTIFVDFI